MPMRTFSKVGHLWVGNDNMTKLSVLFEANRKPPSKEECAAATNTFLFDEGPYGELQTLSVLGHSLDIVILLIGLGRLIA